MDVGEERQENDVRLERAQGAGQPGDGLGRGGQSAVGKVEEHRLAQPEDGPGAHGLGLARARQRGLGRGDLAGRPSRERVLAIALAAVGQVDDAHAALRRHRQRQRAATAEHLVVHVRRQGDHAAAAWRRRRPRLVIALQQREMQAQRVAHGLGDVAAIEQSQDGVQRAAHAATGSIGASGARATCRGMISAAPARSKRLGLRVTTRLRRCVAALSIRRPRST